MMAAERDAKIENGRAVCPWCGSGDMRYVEDLTTACRIVELTDDVLWIEQDGEIDDLAFNERLRCEQCGESAELPEWLAVERKE